MAQSMEVLREIETIGFGFHKHNGVFVMLRSDVPPVENLRGGGSIVALKNGLNEKVILVASLNLHKAPAV
jgi:hypothetical protein